MPVFTTLRLASPRLRLALFAALALCACSLAFGAAVGVPAALSAGAKRQPKAHPAASSYLTGVADEETEMFTAPLWKQLNTHITRYIAPYDAAVRPYSLTLATRWIHAAEAAHQQVLVSFYHSEYTPTKMPSVKTYEQDTRKFMKDFPNVHQYQPWDETNRGNVRYSYEKYNSPTAVESAEYYKALRHVCPKCTILGLDILDQNAVGPTIRYISEFKTEIRRLRMPMPRLWGLHNYSDTNRFSSERTRAILKVVSGQIWLTETGGIVKFGGAFADRHGEGLKRAAKALSFMFSIASAHARIKRLYIYQWTGGTSSTIFDSGLTDAKHRPRSGYVIVCKHLHGKHCNVKVSSQ
ncbi:MAG TPA: hypothetical protein VIJ66_09695 [Solirubrobacteraceae bacterium]